MVARYVTARGLVGGVVSGFIKEIENDRFGNRVLFESAVTVLTGSPIIGSLIGGIEAGGVLLSPAPYSETRRCNLDSKYR